MDKKSALAFDLNAIGRPFIEDPFPTLENLRKHDPIHWNPDGSVYLTRYRDVFEVYRDKSMSSDKVEAFKDKFGECPLFTHHTTSLIFNDPPYHTVVRKLLSGAFTPRKLVELEPLIDGIVDNLLDNLDEEKEFDFISSFAMKLPTELISYMLGIPEQHRHKLRQFSIAILSALDPVVTPELLEKGNSAVAEFGTLLIDLIEHRRRNPEGAGQGEILEALIFGEHDGRRLTQEELVQNCIFLLNAGHETTTSLVGNAMGILLDNPLEYRRLHKDPDLIHTAVEEFLRFQSPLQIGNRLTTQDTILSDVKIPAGTYIHTSIGGANRDPDVFDNPNNVDLGRNPNKHLAFAGGIHVCMGAALARIEGSISIGKLVKRFSNLEATANPEITGLARFRGFKKLPVRISS